MESYDDIHCKWEEKKRHTSHHVVAWHNICPRDKGQGGAKVIAKIENNNKHPTTAHCSFKQIQTHLIMRVWHFRIWNWEVKNRFSFTAVCVCPLHYAPYMQYAYQWFSVLQFQIMHNFQFSISPSWTVCALLHGVQYISSVQPLVCLFSLSSLNTFHWECWWNSTTKQKQNRKWSCFDRAKSRWNGAIPFRSSSCRVCVSKCTIVMSSE